MHPRRTQNPQHYNYRVMINRSTWYVSLLCLAIRSRPRAWLKTARVSNVPSVCQMLHSRTIVSSRAHIMTSNISPPHAASKQQLVDLMLSLVRRPTTNRYRVPYYLQYRRISHAYASLQVRYRQSWRLQTLILPLPSSSSRCSACWFWSCCSCRSNRNATRH
jgi:hypothetical protein